jgi:hypothetical protein
MKFQRKHRLPVGYKLTNELEKSRTFTAKPWQKKAASARGEGSSILKQWGLRRSRKPVTLAKPKP